MDGVVRIPKTVFESNSTALSSDVVATVRRIDGTVEELKRMAPDNPNFQPRKPTPGRVKAINKDEVSAWPSIGNCAARQCRHRPSSHPRAVHAGVNCISQAEGAATAGRAAEQGR